MPPCATRPAPPRFGPLCTADRGGRRDDSRPVRRGGARDHGRGVRIRGLSEYATVRVKSKKPLGNPVRLRKNTGRAPDDPERTPGPGHPVPWLRSNPPDTRTRRTQLAMPSRRPSNRIGVARSRSPPSGRPRHGSVTASAGPAAGAAGSDPSTGAAAQSQRRTMDTDGRPDRRHAKRGAKSLSRIFVGRETVPTIVVSVAPLGGPAASRVLDSTVGSKGIRASRTLGAARRREERRRVA